VTPLRVAVDLLFFTGARGGMETYVRELFPALSRVAPDVRFVALGNAESRSGTLDWFPGPVRSIPLSGESRLAWAAGEVAVVAPMARYLGADVLHCPANFGPGVRLLPTVVTIHDLLSFRRPDLTAGAARGISVLSRLVRRSATRVLTVSEATADDIRHYLAVPAEDIDVVPLASRPPGEVVPAGLPAAVGAPTRPVVLSTGNRMPHKNFPTLLRAWSQMPADRRPLLVVTGSHGQDPLAPLVAELQLHEDVTLLGWVAADELEQLYARADLYVFPTLFEGFGLPVLEAMQRGCPVLASDIPVLREVGGDAATYTDMERPDVVAEAVLRLLADRAQLDRQSTAGRRRAAQFSWDAVAEQTAQTYRRAAGER
jgi:glycosyltransferase involved in cell wall biosynthesis